MEEPVKPDDTIPTAESDRRQFLRRVSDSFRFKGFGVEAEGTGKSLPTLIFVVFFAVFVYFAMQHDKNSSEALSRIEASSVKQAKLMEGVIWVLTKQPNDRELLNLNKPESIKELEKKQ